jgi:hypothetical protein
VSLTTGEASELFVVADRPRRDDDLLGDLSDSRCGLLDEAHPASSTGSRPVGAPAGTVAWPWWYLPPEERGRGVVPEERGEQEPAR